MRQEEEIDRVLQALARAEPAPGLEKRILQRLDAGDPLAAKSSPKLSLGWPVWVAGALAALLLATALPHPHHPAAPQQAEVVPVPPPAPLALPPRAPGPHRSGNDRQPVQSRATPGPTPRARPEHPDRGLADLPSLLAPPERLTPQERQLAVIARGPASASFDLLNARAREQLDERSAAQFKQFFPPPTPQEIYLATHLDN